MGREVTLNLGFDAASRRITIDGKKHGTPVDFAAILEHVCKSIDREKTHRERLLSGSSTRAHIWGSTPKPPEGEA